MRFWPVQWQDPRFGYVWYTDPCVLIDQVCLPRATVPLVTALHDCIDHVLAREKRDIAAHSGLLMIHDWRLLDGYDSEARKLYLSRMARRQGGYLRQVVAVLPGTPLLKMAAQTADLIMALRIGGKLSFANDMEKVLEQYRVMRPVRGGWH